MARRGAFGLFVLAAAGLHAGALLAIGPRFGGAAAPAGPEDTTARVAVADPELAALIEAWNTPPETGEAALLEGPAESAPPPDTETAAEIEAAVAAALALEALGPVSGPGKEAVRPIFAPPPSTSTAPPPTLALRAMPDDVAIDAPLGARAALSPGLAGPEAPGGGLAPGLAAPSLGPADAGAGFALPDRPEEESFAPETAPLPVPRPAVDAERPAGPSEPPEPTVGGAGALVPGAMLPSPALPGATLAAPGLLPAGLGEVPALPYPEEEEDGSDEANEDEVPQAEAEAGKTLDRTGVANDLVNDLGDDTGNETGNETGEAGADPATSDGPDADALPGGVALPGAAPVAQPAGDAEADAPAGG